MFLMKHSLQLSWQKLMIHHLRSNTLQVHHLLSRATSNNCSNKAILINSSKIIIMEQVLIRSLLAIINLHHRHWQILPRNLKKERRKNRNIINSIINFPTLVTRPISTTIFLSLSLELWMRASSKISNHSSHKWIICITHSISFKQPMDIQHKGDSN